MCSRSAARICATRRRTSAARGSNGCSRSAKPPIHLTPMTRDRAAARGVAVAVRGRRARRRDRQAGGRGLSAGQARDDQDQARAHGRLRRRRVPLAQDGKDELVGSLLLGLYDDERPAASRRRHVVVHDGARGSELASELAPLRDAGARRSSVARVGGGRRRGDRRGCPAGRAAGARARICPGSRCASSACAR